MKFAAAVIQAGMIAIVLLGVTVFPWMGRTAEKAAITVAAASSLRDAFYGIARLYEARYDGSVTLVFGSSGHLARQIENGAPYDVFASANADWVARLVRGGLVNPALVTPFAGGRLVLLVNRPGLLTGSAAELSRDGLNLLRNRKIRFVAIANPNHAPYGLAARQVLQRAGLWDELRSKVVYGEDVRQAQQFVESGNADAGLLALSLLGSPDGDWKMVSAALHAPIVNTVAIVSATRHSRAAKAFSSLLRSRRGGEILTRAGLTPLESAR